MSRVCGRSRLKSMITPGFLFSSTDAERFDDIVSMHDDLPIAVAPTRIGALCARRGNLLAMEWLYEHGYPYTTFAMQIACEEGNLEMVRCLVRRGCDATHKHIQTAKNHGHEHIVEWLSLTV